MKFHVNNTALLIAIVASFLLALNAVLGFVLTNQSKAAMKSLFQNRVLDIANTAAAMLNGDELKALRAEDKDTPAYRRINDTLTYFQDNIDLDYIYCIQAVGEKEFVFSVDPTVEDPGVFGEPIVYTEALYKASKGTPAVDDESYTDAWGSFYSAYSPVFDSEGNVAGIVAVDFSASWYDAQIDKQMQTIIICMAVSLLLCVLLVLFVTRHLRQRVNDMTKDLQHALEIAQSGSRAKTAFLSSVSHEIRTPMNAIIGLNHIALENPNLPPETREQFKKIGASAKHLLSIINDILDVSRIESGRTVLKNEEFAFNNVIEQVNVIIGSQCRDKGLIYDCRAQAVANDFYIGDSVKIKQVLINILGNAVKFTPKGGTVTLQIEKTAEFDRKTTLKFTIKDTGIGMSEDYIPKIFDAFSRENDSAQNQYGSTGLGMAITKGIVDLLNGQISVESTKGVGTTFTVVITLTRAEPDAAAHPPAQETIDIPISTADLNGRRILLAEDVEVNAEIIKEVLKMRGMLVEHAENGQIAVDMFSAQPSGYYDAILMDMQMPVLNGLEATKRIRSLDRTDAKKIPIIALTANAFDEDVQRSMQAGMNSHLSKPIEPDTIYRTLEKLISSQM
ncbi:MAG: response regulator [Selenomonadaceae bacterium]|nr:response regulator [Selenomonadaceae bacterium]